MHGEGSLEIETGRFDNLIESHNPTCTLVGPCRSTKLLYLGGKQCFLLLTPDTGDLDASHALSNIESASGNSQLSGYRLEHQSNRAFAPIEQSDLD